MSRHLTLLAVAVVGSACAGGPVGREPAPTQGPPAGVADQSLPLRIAFLDRDSLGLELGKPGYLLVMEYGGGRPSKVLYPAPHQGWTWTLPGMASVHTRLEVLGEDGDHLDGPAQCLVDAQSVSSWTSSDGMSPSPVRALCGPIPTLRPTDSPPPRRAHRSQVFNYEAGSPLASYLVVILVTGDITPEGASGGDRTVVPPVQRARAIGDWLAWPRRNPAGWHAVVWVAP